MEEQVAVVMVEIQHQLQLLFRDNLVLPTQVAAEVVVQTYLLLLPEVLAVQAS
jgi:hypothetical protein